MTKQITQHAGGNVQNMVAGDQHNHYHYHDKDEQQLKAERRKMRSELLQYREGKLPELHNLLCDYAKQHFGNGKITELDDNQLAKLYRYYQTILTVCRRLTEQTPPAEPPRPRLFARLLCFLGVAR